MTLHFTKKDGGGTTTSNSNKYNNTAVTIPPAVKEEIWHPSTGKKKRKHVTTRNRLGCWLTLLFGFMVMAMVLFLLRVSSGPKEDAQIYNPKGYKEQKRNRYNSRARAKNKKVAEDDIDDPLSCQNMLQRVTNQNIQLVAIDFDKTIVDLHTGGHWRHRTSKLVPHVRPAFKCFISSLVNSNVPVAVATFSSQTELIQEVLERSLRSSVDQKKKDWQDIPVFGGDARVEGQEEGKQSQLILAMEHFNKHLEYSGKQPIITAQSTLLVDDDPDNIQVAQADGYHTILYRRHRKTTERELSHLQNNENI